MLEQRIQQQFFENADLQNQAAEILSRPLARAAEAMAGCITAGGKVLVGGSQGGALLSPLLGNAFTGRFERERPPLAALALRDESSSPMAQQVQALGQPGDLLLLLDAGDTPSRLLQAARAAHAADMSVIVLTGADAARWREDLLETDTLISVPHERAARVLETHLLALHCLCDAVDLQLMGEQESS
ncbi:MAG: SIS domain-containing protein [Rubrivivax sp.]|nr:SIS domain-containing protein [Rubrivivax sp.]